MNTPQDKPDNIRHIFYYYIEEPKLNHLHFVPEQEDSLPTGLINIFTGGDAIRASDIKGKQS